MSLGDASTPRLRMCSAVSTAIDDELDRAVDLASTGFGVEVGVAEDIVEQALNSVEVLLDEHRRLIYRQLIAEADRYTKGAFADGIRHAAAAVLSPPEALLDASQS